jgi:hypothetical protein
MLPNKARLVLALAAFVSLAGAGCGVRSYTEKEARDATFGQTGFVLVDDAELRAVVEVTEIGGGPLYAVHLTFMGVDVPLVSDVRVEMTVGKGAAAADVPSERLLVRTDSCGRGGCHPVAVRVEARPSPASARLPDQLDDFDVVVTYTLERAHRLERVTRRVSAHPVRDEKHHYFWIFRDC